VRENGLDAPMPVDRQDGEPGRRRPDGALTFPLRLRCASVSDLLTSDELEDAVARGVGRAFSRARRELPAADVLGSGVVLQSPQLVNGKLAPNEEAALLGRLRRAIERAAQSQALPLAAAAEAGPPSAAPQSAPSMARVKHTELGTGFTADGAGVDTARQADSELFHLARYEPHGGPGHRRGGHPLPPPPSEKWLAAMRGQDEEFLQRLKSGDMDLLSHFLEETNSLHVEPVVKEFGRRHPILLQRMLRQLLRKHAKELAATLRREDWDLVYTSTPVLDAYIETTARIAMAARLIPEARGLLSEGEAVTPGVARIQGLIDALVAMYHRLWEMLQRNTVDPVPEAVTDDLSAKEFRLPRLAGVVAALAGDPGEAPLLSELQLDLVENFRWMMFLYDRVESLNLELAVFHEFYGRSADQSDEVSVLRTARLLYLDPISTVMTPTRAKIAELLTDADQYYEDRVGRIGDVKLERIFTASEKLSRFLTNLLGGASDPAHFSGFAAGDVSGATLFDTAFGQAFIRTRNAVDELASDAADAFNKRSTPDYVPTLHAIEIKSAPLGVQTQLLYFWRNVIDFKINITGSSLRGSRSAPGWFADLDRVRDEVKAQYDTPDYPSLNIKFHRWQKELEDVRRRIELEAIFEATVSIAIIIFVTIATWGVGAAVTAAIGGGAALTAGETLVVVIAEAGTFTLLTSVAQPLLLGKPVDPGAAAWQFAESAATFGIFRLFSMEILAAARRLAPGRTLTQLGLIFGGTALVGALPAAYELVKTRIETGRWSTQVSVFMGANLVFTLALAAFTGGKMRTALATLNKADILAQLYRLDAEAAGVGERLRSAAAGTLSQAEFDELQARVARVLPDFEGWVRRLNTEFSDAELAQLGFQRQHLRDFPDRLSELADFIAALRYAPPEASAPQRALAEAVGTTMTQTGSHSFEYDPATLTPAVLRGRLRARGFHPDDLGGGVLRLTLPHGESAYLLPAGRPRLALEDLIGADGTISAAHPKLRAAYENYLARCQARGRAPMDPLGWAKYATRGDAAAYLTQVLGSDWRTARQVQYPGYHPELIERATAAPTDGTAITPGGAVWSERRVPIGEIQYAIDEIGEPYWTFPDLRDGQVLVLPSGTRVWRDPHTRMIWEEHPVSASVSAKRALTAGESVIPSATEMGPSQAGSQRAHGAASPGLGFDSPYSVARTPPAVNLSIENAGIELWMRKLRNNAAPGVQYLFTTGTARQSGSLTERIYKVSASSGGKIYELVTFRVTVDPAGTVAGPEILSVSAEPMSVFGTPKNVDLPPAFRRRLGFEIRASAQAKIAPALSAVAERNQLMGTRLGELYVRMAAQGNRAQLLDIEQAQGAVAQAEIFLSSAAPSDPRIGQLDAELRDLAQRVGKWQRRADAGRLNRFVDTVHNIIGH
jgi:hypothetical protein